MTTSSLAHGGDIIAEALFRQGVRHLFTLCGGHISPILTGCDRRGIRVVDTRDEASAVFAADAVARLTGTVGAAAVTAGPGVTNAITALKNAQMAQTPLVLLGGATATLLKNRGSLQDIDHLALVNSLCKWATSVSTVPALGPTIDRAIELAQSGVPGPVFVEVPVDILYPEAIVRQMYEKEAGLGKARGVAGKALEWYIRAHLYKQFHAPSLPGFGGRDLGLPELRLPSVGTQPQVAQAQAALAAAQRPVVVVGNQTLVSVKDPQPIADALCALGAPVYLAGAARGLLGRQHELQLRHARGAALREADLVLICGFPFDFRLGYGRGFARDATIIAANLSATELRKNRRPDIAVQMHPGEFVRELAALAAAPPPRWAGWLDRLRGRDEARDAEIATKAQVGGDRVDPLHFLRRVDSHMSDDAVLVVDGGDFVATASYIVRPRGPLSWLDPGVFGTLGVGGGFALGACLAAPGREVWLLWGDGSSAYSLAEFDTFVRHGVAPIAIIGNDASWMQIAREQVGALGTSLGTDLRSTDYHQVAAGYGGVGIELRSPDQIDAALTEAKRVAASGRPVCINVHLQRTDFRKGSISI